MNFSVLKFQRKLASQESCCVDNVWAKIATVKKNLRYRPASIPYSKDMLTIGWCGGAKWRIARKTNLNPGKSDTRNFRTISTAPILTLLSFGFFCALTLNQPDEMVIKNGGKVKIPFVDMQVDFLTFLIIGPIALLGICELCRRKPGSIRSR